MANAVFETVRESGMDTAAVCGNLGVLRAQLGDIEGARKAFKDSLSRDPKFVETYKNAALLEIKMGREGEAKALLMKGREIQPENPEINALLTSLMNQVLVERRKIERKVKNLCFECFAFLLRPRPMPRSPWKVPKHVFSATLKVL
jgi:tetratricopeptide (TPR) repeat protein